VGLRVPSGGRGTCKKKKKREREKTTAKVKKGENEGGEAVLTSRL